MLTSHMLQCPVLPFSHRYHYAPGAQALQSGDVEHPTHVIVTTAARLYRYLYLDHSYVTAATEATLYVYNCLVWLPHYLIGSMTERSKFLFMTSLFSVVGHSCSQ